VLITSKWINNYQSAVDNGRTDAVIMDLPPNKNGEDTGATALEFVVMALAGCITTIFVVVAKSMRLQFDDLKAVVKAEKPEDAKTITEAITEIRVKSDAPLDRIQRCIDLTLPRCPVGNLFEQAKVKMEIKVIKE
jgi:uncharacterized OsmC-like protein